LDKSLVIFFALFQKKHDGRQSDERAQADEALVRDSKGKVVKVNEGAVYEAFDYGGQRKERTTLRRWNAICGRAINGNQTWPIHDTNY
jgi:hypothetical protein